MYAIHLHATRRLIRSARFLLFLVILAGVCAKTSHVLTHDTWSSVYHLDSFQIYYYKVLNANMMTIFVIPFFLAMNTLSFDVLHHPGVLLKYKRVTTWWNSNWFASGFTALITVFSVNVGLAVSTLLSDARKDVSAAWLTSVMVVIVIQTLMLVNMGALQNICSMVFGKRHIGYLLVVGAFSALHFSKSVWKYLWPTPDEWMTLLNLYPVNVHVGDTCAAITVLSALSIATWWLGRKLAQRRDYVW
jgi:hypothetical protein